MNAINTVPFHNHNLLLIEHNGEAFAAMKPIVEGMGLAWGAQQQKITKNAKRWATISITDTVAQDGKKRDMLSMPVRKLPAFFASIHPNKVKPELRATIEKYQDECDNALWAYWNEGMAVNPRATISPAQQRLIQEKVNALAAENKAYGKYYGSIKTKFKVAKYNQLLVSDFDEALQVLDGVVVEEKKAPTAKASQTNAEKLLHQAAFLDGKMIVTITYMHELKRQASAAFEIIGMMQNMKSAYENTIDKIQKETGVNMRLMD